MDFVSLEDILRIAYFIQDFKRKCFHGNMVSFVYTLHLAKMDDEERRKSYVIWMESSVTVLSSGKIGQGLHPPE